ncbi:hypothetical protein FAZ19_04720 [Sphingobacterium alkalisoli]|uniref:Uncharacterized protein n=1 Tax=Sphingobacterium alkalisoli TaxID=1874115 RepID=A0A4U0H9P2_9SPHI|nr:hypothetical protein [Sphingobacterium alkalisoli]TJY68561.1 hypothetical protein FAZ19_04720 [Sphingobacterium alkalisoli]GGH05672.1 hypothetical protein GCM10011418_01930 [Sphingobacterium alkalisoli]
MDNENTFVERQYLGRDKTWISVRLILALFCFIAYYLNLDHLASRQLFFIVGGIIIVVSVVMMYMLLYKTQVTPNNITISGLWSTSLVKIDLSSIISVEKKPYSNFIFNNPVYNLHTKGKIRFYAGGRDAVWLKDREGLVYIIGTHKAEELTNAILKAKRTES